jgi:hypothetical protein
MMDKKSLQVINLVRKAMTYKGLSSQLFEIIQHKLKINTSPIDYYRFEFYKDNKTWEEKSRYIGKRCSNFYPWQSNSVQFIPLFDNKYIFSIMLSGFGLPHPQLFSTIGEDYEIKSFAQFRQFMATNTDNKVFKPLDGSGGRGVFVLRFENGHHYDLTGVREPEEIWDMMKTGKEAPHPYLVEELVEQDPHISALYPESLNTMRIITLKTKDKCWHCLGAWLRVGQSGQVDNLGAGGIMLSLTPDGRSNFAYDYTAFKKLERHPLTGVNLLNVCVPGYKDAVELALRVSEKFSFMGTIGWDIGLSVKGPVIIEGNIFYNCANWQTNDQPPLISTDIANKIDRRRWWHSWDKTYIYPNVNRWKIKA